MASEYIIDFLGEGALDQIQHQVPDALDAIAKQIVEINNLVSNTSKVGNVGNTRQLIDNLNQLNIAQGAAVKISQQLQQMRKLEIAGTKELLSVQKAASDAEIKANNDANKITTANIQASINAIKQKADAQKAASAQLIKSYNDEQQAQIDNINLTKKLQAQVDTINKQKEAQAKAASKELINQYDKENQAQLDNIKQARLLQKAIDDINRKKAQEEAQIRKNNDAYEQLKIEYNAAAANAKTLAAEYFNLQRSGQAGSNELKEMGIQARDASKQALSLHKELLGIEQAVGQSQRNVGNYNALLFETNQILRELPNFAISGRTGILSLSNNLPMFADQFQRVAKEIDETTGKAKGFGGALKEVGGAIFSWQTLLILGVTFLVQYSDQITAWAKSLFSGSAAAAKMAENQRELNDVTQKATETAKENAAETASSAEILYKAATDTNNSMKDRKRAAQEMIDQWPQIFAGFSQEAIMAGKAKDAYDELTEAIERKIALDVNEEQAKTLYKQMADAKEALQQQQDAVNAFVKFDAMMKGQVRASQKDINEFQKQNAKAIAQGANTSKKDMNALIDVYTQAYAQYHGLTSKIAKDKENIDSLLNNSPDNKKSGRPVDTTNAEISSGNDLIEAQARLNKAQIEADAAAQKEISDNQKNSLDQRLAAYGQYVNDQIALYELDSGVELAQVQNKLSKIEEIEKIDASKRTKQQQKLLLDKDALLTQESAIETEHASKVSAIWSNAAKEQSEIIKSSSIETLREISQSMQEIESQIDSQTRDNIDLIQQNFLNGNISYEKAQQRIKLVQDKGAIDSAQRQIEAYKAILNAGGLTADEIIKIEKNLNDEENKLTDGRVKYFKDKEDERKKKAEDTANAIKGISEASFDALFGVLDNVNKKQIDNISQQKTAIDARYQAEIDAINNSSISDDEKQKKSAQLSAQQAAMDAKLDAETRKRNQQEAIYDKASTIFKITLNTAEQVSKLIATPPLAIAAAAEGAAQLVIAATAPIPHYWQGTDNHPGGPAIVGERGPELVNLPSGSSFITPGIPTVMDLPRHTEVIPHQEIMNAAHVEALRQVSGIKNVQPDNYAMAMIKAYESQTSKIIHAIKNKQEVHFKWSNGELKKSIKHGNSWTHYVDNVV